MAFKFNEHYIEKRDLTKKFVQFLHNEGCICDEEINKNIMRKKLQEFSILCNFNIQYEDVLVQLCVTKIIQKPKKNNPIIHFNKELLMHIINEKSRGQSINNNLSAEKCNERAKNTCTDKVNNSKYISGNGCEMCNVKFKDAHKMHNHYLDNVHKLRYIYRNNKEVMVKNFKDISVYVKEDTDDVREKVYFKRSKMKTYLTIDNKSSQTFYINDIIFLYKDIPGIEVQRLSFPIVLTRNKSAFISIDLNLETNFLYLLPLLLTISNNNNKDINILKELVFQYESDLRMELKSAGMNNGRVRPLLNWVDLPIISGIRPERLILDLKMTRPLLKSPIPKSLDRIIRNGLHAFDKMNSKDKEHLAIIRELQSLQKKEITLNPFNYCDMLKFMIYFDEYQANIDIHQYDCSDQILTHFPNRPDLLTLKVPGLAENRPSLMRGDSVLATMPNAEVRYEGIVHYVYKDYVELGFHKQFTHVIHKPHQRYEISFQFHRLPYMIEQQAIDLTKDHRIAKFFFPKSVSTQLAPKQKFNWFNKNILNNKEQQQAVEQIVACSSYPYPYLIFGPPGTGKTMTLVEAVYQIWKTKSCNILITTPSNSAANEITERLVKYKIPTEDMYRLISHNHVLDKCAASAMIPYCNIINDQYIYPPIERLMMYRILILTLHSCAKLVGAEIPCEHFKYVFIDESGHATEPQTLSGIAGVISSGNKTDKLFGQVILAGDPEQLGPHVNSDFAEKCRFGVSMLERLMTTCPLYQKNPRTHKYDPRMLTKLLKNYRSHKDILALPNKLFYDGDLLPQEIGNVKMAIGWEHLPNKAFPIIFHSVMGAEELESNSPSFFNISEIEIVVDYLRKLLNNKMGKTVLQEEDVGVVTPYRKQVQKIQQACQNRGWNNVLVNSVEKFQGQERSIIIVSTVRSCPEFLATDYKFNIGFLKNRKRFNVSITRAKALLIVIGNPYILMNDHYWYEFISYCDKNNATAGIPFKLRQ